MSLTWLLFIFTQLPAKDFVRRIVLKGFVRCFCKLVNSFVICSLLWKVSIRQFDTNWYLYKLQNSQILQQFHLVSWLSIFMSFFKYLQVDVTSVSRENDDKSSSHLYKLDVREPRLRRVRYGRVLTNYPVNEKFEEQLSRPFYFRQKEHGTLVEVLFPKATETPEVAAFKKGTLKDTYCLGLDEYYTY